MSPLGSGSALYPLFVVYVKIDLGSASPCTYLFAMRASRILAVSVSGFKKKKKQGGTGQWRCLAMLVRPRTVYVGVQVRLHKNICGWLLLNGLGAMEYCQPAARLLVWTPCTVSLAVFPCYLQVTRSCVVSLPAYCPPVHSPWKPSILVCKSHLQRQPPLRKIKQNDSWWRLGNDIWETKDI